MTIETSHALLSAALNYASRGWYVIPLHDVTTGVCSCGKPDCKKPGKHPHIDEWTGDGASIDPTQIQDWWRQWPHANVGLQTGHRSKLAVLDVDPRNGGDVALDDLIHSYSPLPETPMAFSGSKGPHYYFRLESPLGKFDPAPGLNLLADGALVVAPPSLHHSGNCYEWEVSSHPDDIPLTPLPDWLRAMGEAKASSQVNGVDLPDSLPVVQLQDLKVSARVKFLILTGTDPDDPNRYPSRSEALFAVMQALLSAKHDDATIASVVMDKRYAISEKVWDQKHPKSPFYEAQTRQWVAKEIARAKAKHQEPPSLHVSQQTHNRTVNRTVPDITQSATADAHQRQNGHATTPALVTRCAADVTPEQVQWLWKPYIALGTICMLALI
jgi:hypothetical protein